MKGIIGKEYNFATISHIQDEGLFQGIILGVHKPGYYKILVTRYTYRKNSSLPNSTMNIEADRLLAPVSTTNRGFVSLLSKED